MILQILNVKVFFLYVRGVPVVIHEGRDCVGRTRVMYTVICVMRGRGTVSWPSRMRRRTGLRRRRLGRIIRSGHLAHRARYGKARKDQQTHRRHADRSSCCH